MLSCLVALVRIASVAVICQTKPVTKVTSGLKVHRTNCFICPFDTLSQQAVDVKSNWLSIAVMFTRICRNERRSNL